MHDGPRLRLIGKFLEEGQAVYETENHGIGRELVYELEK
jgi:hypothetical protein